MTTTPLAPEAVASLTDAELSEAVARVVLGALDGQAYSEENDGEEPEYPFYDKDGEGNVLLYSDEWEDYRTFNCHPPFTFADPRAVSLVLEHMRQRWAGRMWKWEIGEEETGEEDGVLVWCAVVRSREGWQVALAESPSFGRATFECALIAAQEMEKEG